MHNKSGSQAAQSSSPRGLPVDRLLYQRDLQNLLEKKFVVISVN